MSLAILDNTELCMRQCRAQCCVGPSYLWLTPQEVTDFARQAEHLGVPSVVHRRTDGGVVRFLEQVGERCPMLDPHTAACRIYDRRPARCRNFPEAPREGCALSQHLMEHEATPNV